MLAWMENQGNLSEEKQQEWLLELTGLKIGVGTNGATNRRLAQSVAIPIQELWQWAQQQQHLHLDETRWRVAGVKRLRGSCREQGTADHRNSGQELTQSDAEVRPVANLIRRL
ncbi:hypothetical protein BJP36_13670 [Moorena producens JHB]|uniref:Uncharacterized protein n=1 Tax=Moorena producens (strain JHB) TaxID=1454205 RepID=A0A1D9FZU1_MOOP1|nr:transposase [Moorena producens]AOY80805.1 hypothetical protein BJP36_13670 [Moorena producens JHB]